MIRFYRKTQRDKSMQELETFRAGAWIYAENPSDAELENLADQFGLDMDLLDDALDPYEVPRFEMDEDILYLYVRFPSKSGDKIQTIPALIILGKNFIATVCAKALPFIDQLTKKKWHFATSRKIRALLVILTRIDEDYNLFLTQISRSIRSLRVQIENIDNKDIIRFVNFEETLNDILAALVPMSTILQRLTFIKSLGLKEHHREELEDLYLNTKELQDLSKTNLRAITNIREGYSTIMSNNLNRVIRLLTVLTIVLTIPTIMSSLYGMNVALPFQHSPYAFWGILGVTGAISALFVLLFIKKKWW